MTGWGSWNPERPAELVHLETGVTLTPLLFSAKAERASLIPPSTDFIFGERSIDGQSAKFRTELEGTILDWCWTIDGDDLTLDWRTVSNGEWGLRFWVAIIISGSANGDDNFEVLSAKDPLVVTMHDSIDAVGQEFEDHGYFYLGSRDATGSVRALRFNLEEASEMRISAGFSDREHPALPQAANKEPETSQPQSSLQAIHDVIAWNHVHDSVNNRPVTLATRFWNARKFGGFGLWMTDTLYNALLWSLFDPAKARQNLEALFVWQTETGNFPCLITGYDQWLDRTQPPVASFVVQMIADQTGDSDLTQWAYPKLLKNHDWWWHARALNDTGFVAYGTSIDVGSGLYKGTKLAAKNESSMDNLPVHDPAPFDADTGLLQSADVGLNSLLALDGEMLAGMARILGHNADAERLQKRSDALKANIRSELWDEKRHVFANKLTNGAFVEPIAPTSFFPMVAGAASEEQIDQLISGYLDNPQKFGGAFGLPSITRDDPAYSDNVYWRGRIWAPLNFWTYWGLRRAGQEDAATQLAETSQNVFETGWRNRQCGENWNAETGAVTDQADTDPFYSWGALMPSLSVSEIVSVDPWTGLSLSPDRIEGSFGPVRTRLGLLSGYREKDEWSLQLNGTPWMNGTLSGRMRIIANTVSGLHILLSETDQLSRLSLPDRTIATVDLDGSELPIAGSDVQIPPGPAGRKLQIEAG